MINRELAKKEGVKRLQHLVSLGLDSDILKRFKTTGIVSVCEANTTGWRQKRKYENIGSTNTLPFFPRTYQLLDFMENVTEDMVEAKSKIEGMGYLVYLVIRTKIDNNDTIDYLIIDKPSNAPILTQNKYNRQLEEFIKGNPLLCFTFSPNKPLKEAYIKLKMKYGNIVREELLV